MDDVIPESESLLFPLNLSPRNGGAREVEKDQQKISVEINEGKDEEEKGGSGGIITHLISMVSPRKPGEVTKRKGEFEVEVDESSEQDVGYGAENGSGGGVFSNLVSNFFNQSDSGGGGGGGGEINEVEKEAEKVMKDIGNKRMKTAEEEEEEEGDGGGGGGGGGIIDNIVSHLATSLPVPADAAPSTDEASILLTSIVKD